jgi:outer membrane protein
MRSIVLLTSFLLLFTASPVLAAKTAFNYDPLLTKKTIRSTPVTGCEAPIPHDKILSLADIAHFSLCNNPLTRESWARVLVQAALLGSNRSAYLPVIDAAVGISNARTETSAATATSTSLTPTLSLSYLLLDFGSRAAAIQVTKQALYAADFTHNATLQNVLFSAIQAYYQLYSAEAAVEAAQLNVKATEASLNAAKLRFKVGVATIADQLQAETVNAQAVLRREQALNQARISRGVLANMLGVSPDYAFKIDSTRPKELNITFSNSIAALLDEARKNRPDFAASMAQLESARANLRLQRTSGLPSITLAATQRNTEIMSGSGSDHDDRTIAATLRIPIFTGFNRSYQIQAARAQLAAQQARVDDTENSILLDVWRTYNNFQTEKETLRMTDTLLASATKSEQVALERYKAGVGSITELLNAQSQLADARQQQVQSLYNWLTTKADMLRALGRLTKDAVKG